jgi:uncharacterized protein (TIGR03382 family)
MPSLFVLAGASVFAAALVATAWVLQRRRRCDGSDDDVVATLLPPT